MRGLIELKLMIIRNTVGQKSLKVLLSNRFKTKIGKKRVILFIIYIALNKPVNKPISKYPLNNKNDKIKIFNSKFNLKTNQFKTNSYKIINLPTNKIFKFINL